MSPPITSRAELAQQILRQDLATFTARAFTVLNPGETYVPGWHIYALCHALEQVYEGKILRLLVTMPPRHLKSICAAVAFPAWALGKDPSLKMILASYGGELGAKHMRGFRSVIEAPVFRRAFPGFGELLRNTAEDVVTARHGGYRAVTKGGAVTGFGGHIIIVDDMMKANEANSASERLSVQNFFTNSVLTRLDNKETGRIIVIQQRLHEDDLPGFLIDKGTYTHLNLPAIAVAPQVFDLGRRGVYARAVGEPLWPEREPLHVLERYRKDLGASVFSAQYQQDPSPPDGQILRWPRIATYEGEVKRETCLQVVQSWDTALGEAPHSCFSVCTTWGFHDDVWKLLDVYRARLAFPDLLSKAKALSEAWRADLVLVENASSGMSLVQSLRQHKSLSRDQRRWSSVVAPTSPTQDKETRLAAGAPLLEDGRVQFPVEAPWLDEFRRELIAFPASKFDDQVDSVSQFLAYAGGRRSHGRLDRARGNGRRTGSTRR